MRVLLISFLFFYSFSYSSEVKWRDFHSGLREAEEKRKLILLDIYAQWCHWCNVMENTTYRDDEVVNLLNKFFIPVKVDAEQYPNINRKYNQGGLPTTAVLDWEGNILWGAVYLPPEKMKKVLLKFSKMTESEIKSLSEEMKNKKIKKLKRLKKSLKEKEITLEKLEKIERYVRFRFDEIYGGYKGFPKFPIRELPYYLMLSYIFGKGESINLLIKTLDGYSKLVDKVEGGVFRYAVNENWTYPHYEKLLKDQAELSILFLNGYSLSGKEEYLNYSRMLIDFSIKYLFSSEEDLFYNSQGADIVDEKGNLLIEGKDFFSMDLEGREKVVKKLKFRPKIEKNIYFTSNSLMAQALLYGYIFDLNDNYLVTALKILEKIKNTAFKDKGVVYSLKSEKFLLSTQVYVLEAFLLGYQITGNKIYLKFSKELVNKILKYYYNPELKIYTDLGLADLEIKDISFLDSFLNLNFRLAVALLKLNILTTEEEYLNIGRGILKRFPDKKGALSGLAYYFYLYPPLGVHIVGSSKNLNKYKNEFFKVFPFYIYPHLIKNSDKGTLEVFGYEPTDNITAYICNCCFCFGVVKKDENFKEIIFNILSKYSPID